MRKLIPVALAAGLLALAACSAEADTQPAGSGVDTESGNTEHPPPADVAITTCAPDPDVGWILAAGTITNHTSKASTYFVQVEFVDANGIRYAEGITSSSTVAPGQAVEWEASGLTEARAGGKCKLISVDRYEA